MITVRAIAGTQLPNTLGDAPVLTAEKYARQARSSAAPLRFATSRSGVPAPVARPEHMTRLCADAFELAGMTPEDGQLNLAAPAPHASGWMAQKGANTVGASLLNRDFTDWERPIDEGTASRATVVSSVPAKAQEMADEIKATQGSAADLFPNLEIGFFTGHLLRPGTRRRLRDRWGLEMTREFYGSSEAGMIAAAVDESRRLVPLLHRHILELEVDDEIVDIRELAEPTEGSLLVTDPARTSVNLTRYRQGDLVRVYPDDPIPRLMPLGRADDAVDFDGALVHPGDLFEAVDEVFPTGSDAIAVVHDAERPVTIEVHIEGATDAKSAAFYEALCTRQPALRHALGSNPEGRLTTRIVDDLDELSVADDDGLKERQIVFTSEQD